MVEPIAQGRGQLARGIGRGSERRVLHDTLRRRAAVAARRRGVAASVEARDQGVIAARHRGGGPAEGECRLGDRQPVDEQEREHDARAVPTRRTSCRVAAASRSRARDSSGRRRHAQHDAPRAALRLVGVRLRARDALSGAACRSGTASGSSRRRRRDADRLIACGVPYAVTMMTGWACCPFCSRRARSSPLIPGNWRSEITRSLRPCCSQSHASSAVRKVFDREAVFGQALGQGPRHGRLVLDDQDVWHRGGSPVAVRCAGTSCSPRATCEAKRDGSRSCTSRAATGPRQRASAAEVFDSETTI